MNGLAAFLAERRVWPWPLDEPVDDPAGAELYKAYLASVKDNTLHLSPKAFGQAVKAAGFESYKGADGRHYFRGLTLQSRSERARQNVRGSLWLREWRRLTARPRAEHRARRHGDGSACPHDMPEDVAAPIVEAVHATMAVFEADGTLDRLVQARYGPYLSWQEGEPHPYIAIRRGELEREIAKLAAKLAEAEPRLDTLQSKERQRVHDLSWDWSADWYALKAAEREVGELRVRLREAKNELVSWTNRAGDQRRGLEGPQSVEEW